MKNDRKKHLAIGIFAMGICMIADWLLDMKDSGNVTKDFVESNWVNMSMWRFEVSLLIGAVVVPLYWVSAKEMLIMFDEGCKKQQKMDRLMEKIFRIGVLSAAFSWVFIHIECCMLPIMFKCMKSSMVSTAVATEIVNNTAMYIMIPFSIYFLLADGCISIGWIYMAWNKKIGIKRWQIICCPLFTLILSAILDMVPVLNQITGAFETMGHFLMLIVMFTVTNKNKKQIN